MPSQQADERLTCLSCSCAFSGVCRDWNSPGCACLISDTRENTLIVQHKPSGYQFEVFGSWSGVVSVGSACLCRVSIAKTKTKPTL